MIDAIFFLLVFFMFSSLSMVKMSSMGVVLPQGGGNGATGGGASSSPVSAKTPAGGSKAGKVVLTVSAEGLVAVDGTPTNPGNIPAMVRLRLAGRSPGIVVVQPEKTGTMQQLVALLDGLNEVTLQDGSRPEVLIATERVDKPLETRSPPGE